MFTESSLTKYLAEESIDYEYNSSSVDDYFQPQVTAKLVDLQAEEIEFSTVKKS